MRRFISGIMLALVAVSSVSFGAGIKGSALPSATTTTSADKTVIIQGGTTKNVTLGNMTHNSFGGRSVSDTHPISAITGATAKFTNLSAAIQANIPNIESVTTINNPAGQTLACSDNSVRLTGTGTQTPLYLPDNCRAGHTITVTNNATTQHYLYSSYGIDGSVQNKYLQPSGTEKFTSLGATNGWIQSTRTDIPDCDNASTSKVLYDVTTNKFTCGTDTGATPVHNNATNRDASDAHPIGAITGLATKFTNISSVKQDKKARWVDARAYNLDTADDTTALTDAITAANALSVDPGGGDPWFQSYPATLYIPAGVYYVDQGALPALKCNIEAPDAIFISNTTTDATNNTRALFKIESKIRLTITLKAIKGFQTDVVGGDGYSGTRHGIGIWIAGNGVTDSATYQPGHIIHILDSVRWFEVGVLVDGTSNNSYAGHNEVKIKNTIGNDSGIKLVSNGTQYNELNKFEVQYSLFNKKHVELVASGAGTTSLLTDNEFHIRSIETLSGVTNADATVFYVSGTYARGNTFIVESRLLPITAGSSVKLIETVNSAAQNRFQIPQLDLSMISMSAANIVDMSKDVGNYAVANINGYPADGAAPNGRSILFASAAPSTSYWKAGDITWNNAPTVGEAAGWMCTTSGTPGTWTAISTLGGSSQWITTGSDIYYVAGKVGVGADAPSANFHAYKEGDVSALFQRHQPTHVGGGYAAAELNASTPEAILTNFGPTIKFTMTNTQTVTTTNLGAFNFGYDGLGNGNFNLLPSDGGTPTQALRLRGSDGVLMLGPSVTDDSSGALLQVQGDVNVASGKCYKMNGTCLPTLATGTYTPTVHSSSNVTTATPTSAQYMRVGDMVTVSGRIAIQAAAAGSTFVNMTLPVASDFAAVQDAGGVIASGATTLSGIISADTTNNIMTIFYQATNTSSYNFQYTYTYRIL